MQNTSAGLSLGFPIVCSVAMLDRALLWSSAMSGSKIDFISSYCDRWCERCGFTNRCAVYECTIAIEMCEDVRDGIELAIGSHAAEALSAQAPSERELEEYRRAKQKQDARIAALPLSRMADVYRSRAVDWVNAHREALDAHPDLIVRDAFAVVSWDTFFIGAKIHRALHGRDRRQHGEDLGDDDPVQNDWNGSAKVALISIARSADAWRALGSATGDAAASALGDALDHLRRTLADAFPDAMAFMRPGFDDPAERGGDHAVIVRPR